MAPQQTAAAPSSPVIDTHRLEESPQQAVVNVQRWTCADCGRAVMRSAVLTYGSATAIKCTTATPAT